MIGERRGEFGSAVKQDEEDEKSDKEEPKEEIEQLEHENEVRADHLGGIVTYLFSHSWYLC